MAAISASLSMAAVGIGGRLPVSRVFDPLPGLGALDYGAEPFRSIVGLERSFIASVLGDVAVIQLGDTSAQETPSAVRGAPDRPDAPARPSPLPPTGGATPPLLPSAAELAVAMHSDRATARPGDRITYTLSVTNVGSKFFVGEFVLQAHTPRNTTYGADSKCPEPHLGLESSCVPVPVPGVGDAAHNPQVNFAFTRSQRSPSGTPCTEVDALGPGDTVCFVYWVTLDPGTPAGTRLLNHAHLQSSLQPMATTPTVEVVVQ